MLHDLLVCQSRRLSERVPRNKYNDVAKATLAYAKQRKHTGSATRRLRRRLLKLLAKLRFQWNGLRKLYGPCISLSAEQEKRLSAVREVCLQQSELFSGKEVKHRIVSIDRPYLRPIVRGKENKRVEFGAKVNNIQIDGISFIEHHSFEAFNEGIRLKQCIEYQESLTGGQSQTCRCRLHIRQQCQPHHVYGKRHNDLFRQKRSQTQRRI